MTMNSRNGSLPPRRGGNEPPKRKSSAAPPARRGAGATGRPGGSVPRNTGKGGSGKKKGKAGRKGGASRFFKRLLAVLLVVLLAFIGYFVYLYMKLENGIHDTGVDKPVPPGQSAKVKPLTMLLLGTDYRPEHPSYLTDVVMVAALNPETKSATVVSLPRDTYIELDGYKRNKLNEYYPRFRAREKDGGIPANEEIKTMMGKYLGVDVDYVTMLNFQAFRDVVDELDGIKVDVGYDMCYVDNADGTNINLKKGSQTLDGKKALDYVRYRKSNCSPKTAGSDDFDRNKRQNEVMHAMMDRMQSFNGLLKIGSVLDAVDGNLQMDLEGDQLKALVSTYWNIPRENVEFKPVTGTWKSPYVYINQEELNAAKQSLQDRLSGKAAPAAPAE